MTNNNEVLEQCLNYKFSKTNFRYEDLANKSMPDMYRRMYDIIGKDYGTINELKIQDGEFLIRSTDFNKDYNTELDVNCLIQIYPVDKTIKVRTIEIKNQKEGKFTNIVKILEEYICIFGFYKIVIENAHTCKIQKWCKKNKFEKKDKLSYIKKYPKFNLPELD